ncbi:MAG: putative metal-binding motif-containing protein [Myxococcota bacterium]
MILALTLAVGCLSWTEADLDGDGVLVDGGDCDDTDPTVYPGALDRTGDGLDRDCDGLDGTDKDGDGALAAEGGGPDCDDSDPLTSPWAPERCDGLDNDCDGMPELTCSLSGKIPVARADRRIRGTGVFLGQLRTFVDSGNSVASLGDLDGDGLGDFAIGGTLTDFTGGNKGSIWIFQHLPDTPLSSTEQADARIDGASGDAIGDPGRIAALADIDGDGLNEFIAGSFRNDFSGNNSGVVYFFSSADPEWQRGTHQATEIAHAIFYGEADTDRLGDRHAAGDLDGDGLAELVLSSSRTSNDFFSDGSVYLLFGGADFPSGAHVLPGPTVELRGNIQQEMAGSGVAIADLDGDGLGELMIGAMGLQTDKTQTGGIYWIPGDAVPRDSGQLNPDFLLPLPPGDWQLFDARSVSVDGDTNGDGLDDLLLMAQGEARENWLIPGRAEGLDQQPLEASIAARVSVSHQRNGGRIVHDLDRDGHAEILFGVSRDPDNQEEGVDCALPEYSTRTSEAGAAWVIYGPLSGTIDTPDAYIYGQPGQQLGVDATTIDDANGDGWPELLVSSQNAHCWSGQTWIFFGGP